MDASCKPSIATEVHARHKRPHRLALLATSPVATGEAKIGAPRKGTETVLINFCYAMHETDLRTRTPQGDGNADHATVAVMQFRFKNQNPARGRSIPPASPARAGEAVNVIQSHFADARVLGTFSHTTCYPISCAQGPASWTGQQGDRVSGGGGAMNASCKPS